MALNFLNCVGNTIGASRHFLILWGWGQGVTGKGCGFSSNSTYKSLCSPGQPQASTHTHPPCLRGLCACVQRRCETRQGEKQMAVGGATGPKQ